MPGRGNTHVAYSDAGVSAHLGLKENRVSPYRPSISRLKFSILKYIPWPWYFISHNAQQSYVYKIQPTQDAPTNWPVPPHRPQGRHTVHAPHCGVHCRARVEGAHPATGKGNRSGKLRGSRPAPARPGPLGRRGARDGPPAPSRCSRLGGGGDSRLVYRTHTRVEDVTRILY